MTSRIPDPTPPQDLPGALGHDRYCSEILTQTRQFRDLLRTADLTAQVPTCPDWTLADLARHVGGAHRWVGTIVAARATEAVDPAGIPGIGGPDGDDPVALGDWLAEGAEETVRALREAGPEAGVWSWSPVHRARFWARRMTHETVIHRADAAGAAGAAFDVPPEVAADCVEEWLQVCALPVFAERRGPVDGLFGPGRTLRLHATDAPPELNAEWCVDLTGDRPVHRRAHEEAAVTLRGPLTDLLLVFYRRRPVGAGGVEVLGDREVLDRWLEFATWG